jgi:hypothetical protein
LNSDDESQKPEGTVAQGAGSAVGVSRSMERSRREQ